MESALLTYRGRVEWTAQREGAGQTRTGTDKVCASEVDVIIGCYVVGGHQYLLNVNLV